MAKKPDGRRSVKLSLPITHAVLEVQRENQWLRAMSFNQIAEVLIEDGLKFRRMPIVCNVSPTKKVKQP